MSEIPHVPKSPSPDVDQSPKDQAEHPISFPGSHRGENDQNQAMKEVGPYLTLGFQLAMFVAIGAGIGWYLDKDSGSSFWTGILAGAGAVAGLVYFLVSVMRLEKNSQKKK
jgi:F0F1-type ATP synthase assembly protein I